MPDALPAGTTVHHQPSPGATVGFVFICPGRFEQARGYPCAAGTGANLARALVVLHARDPARFASPDRSAYVVTNAWPVVEYPALTGRSVPTPAEVTTSDNLARLACDLRGLTTLVACGSQAQAAVRALVDAGELQPAPGIAYARHLSQRSVNMIDGAADTTGRIAVWCEGVLAQLPAA